MISPEPLIFAEVKPKLKFKAKCGFKFILLPKMKRYNNTIIYNNEKHKINNKFYISFTEQDIETETMFQIKLKNCSILSKYILSKDTDCNLPFNTKYQLMPIVEKNNNIECGGYEYYFVYNPYDYININFPQVSYSNEWNISDMVLTTSIDDNEDKKTSILNKFDFNKFSFQDNEFGLVERGFPVIRKFYLNKLLYERFINNYNLRNDSLRFYPYGLQMDVFDIDEIDSIIIVDSNNNKSNLQINNLAVLDIHYKKINKLIFSDLEELTKENDRYKYIEIFASIYKKEKKKVSIVIEENNELSYNLFYILIRINRSKIKEFIQKTVIQSLLE